MTLTLAVEIANSGNISTGQPVTVRFYTGKPGQGGTRIGETQLSAFLSGCGAKTIARVQWPDLDPGVAQVWAEVDPDNLVPETDEHDNLVSGTIVIPSTLLHLPLVMHRTH